MAGMNDRVLHLKKKLEREVDKHKILNTLNELSRISMSVDLLQKTGIGKTVRVLRKKSGEIGSIANGLYTKWKQIVTQPPSVDVKNSVKKDLKAKDSASVSRSLIVESGDSYTVYDGEENNRSQSKLKMVMCNDRDNSTKSKRTKIENNSKTSVQNGEIEQTIQVMSKPDGKKKSSDGREKTKVKHSTESSPSKDKHKSKSKKRRYSSTEGFDSSIASFEACLGLGDFNKNAVSTKKKTNSPAVSPKKSVRTTPKPTSTNSSSVRENTAKQVDQEIAELASPKSNVVDISSTLPTIQPNYKPIRFTAPDSPPRKKKSGSSEIDPAMFMSSKHTRTQVFSGRRGNFSTEVPSLYEMCIRVLQENIDALEYTGGVPFDQLKPVLLRCTPQQLYQVEDYNPYLLEDTDVLWMAHCRQDFRGQEPGELETWREFYLRKYDEREAKLKSITANISASMAKAVPVRQTKLAYVDTVAKPPRGIARRQQKFGTGLPVDKEIKAGPPSKATPRSMVNIDLHPEASTSGAKAPVKKIAPLMQKTLKFMKNRFRR